MCSRTAVRGALEDDILPVRAETLCYLILTFRWRLDWLIQLRLQPPHENG